MPSDVDHNRYAPVYLVAKDRSGGSSAGLRQVLFSTGSSCMATNHARFDVKLNLETLHQLPELLHEQHGLLEPFEEHEGLVQKSMLGAIDQVYETADFVVDCVQGSQVRDTLEGLAMSKALPAWMDSDDSKTFFELQCQPDGKEGSVRHAMRDVEAALCKVYIAGLSLHLAYFEVRDPPPAHANRAALRHFEAPEARLLWRRSERNCNPPPALGLATL